MTHPSRLNIRMLRLASGRRVRGFTVIELSIVIATITILASLYARFGASLADEQRGKNMGQLVAAVHNAAEDYALNYRTQILNNTAITVPASVAITRQPTTAELFALGETPNLMSAVIPNAGNIQVTLSPSPAGCVMPACAIQILTYITGPVLRPNDNTVAWNVLAVATREAGARAGGSEPFAPTRLRGLGGQWDAANPVAGTPVGIFAMLSSTSDVGSSKYVQIQDTRDPNLQGPLTVAGATTLNGATTINNAATVTQNLTVTQQVTGDRFIPTGAYAVNTACPEQSAIAKNAMGSGLVYCSPSGFWRSLATEDVAGNACAPAGSQATNAAGVSMLCVNGGYQLMSDIIRSGTRGAACAVPGSTGIDTANNNETLICRSNPADAANVLVWFRLRDVTQHLQFVFANVVGVNQTVTKPTCPVGANQLMIATAKATSTPDGGTHVYGEDTNSTQWTLRMVNGAGLTMVAGTESLVQTYCYFP